MHASTSTPSPEACAELITSMRAFSALRRDLRTTAPSDAPSWLPVLFALHRNPAGLRIGQLADELHVDASVASRQVARLEASGHARREPDPDDGRAHVLQLTQVGHEQLGVARDAIARHIAIRLDGWTDVDVLDLAGGLHRLTTSLGDAPTPGNQLDLPSPFDTTTRSGAAT